MAGERGLGRGAVRGALPPLTAPAPRAAVPQAPGLERARRLRSPLLIALWVLLALESAGGLLIFFARVAYGRLPDEALHVLAGAALTAVYALYQWRHWRRVRPFRARLDYALGLIAALSLSPVHNITSMLTMTFVASHFGLVLARDRRAAQPGRG